MCDFKELNKLAEKIRGGAVNDKNYADLFLTDMCSSMMVMTPSPEHRKPSLCDTARAFIASVRVLATESNFSVRVTAKFFLNYIFELVADGKVDNVKLVEKNRRVLVGGHLP